MKRQPSFHQNFRFGVILHIPGTGRETEIGGFSEVNGLGAETVIAKHGSSDSLDHGAVKIRRLHNPNRVTLKRGLVNRLKFSEWMDQGQKHDIKVKHHLFITMRDEQGHAIQSWKLQAVLPLKLTGPDLTATGNDVAIEELELSHEGIEVISEEPPDSNCA